jgi:glycosyltransferase involved in cell wall biosynthesis
MFRNHKISVYFPCRNEGNHLEHVFAKIPDFVDEILVISNKSTDDTVQKAKKLGAIVIEDNRSVGNIGYGYAHITGMNAATGDILIPADGDGTYPIWELESILNEFLDRDLDFMNCNRYPLANITKIPFKLQLGVNVLNLETNLLYGTNIKDILSGMWVIKKTAILKLELTEGGWNLSPQIKIQAATNKNMKFGEFHIVQHLRHGNSHQQYFKTGLEHLSWIFKNRFALVKVPVIKQVETTI